MRDRILLTSVLVVALLVRLIGLNWGDGFQSGFRGHHVDEWTHVVMAGTLIDPKVPPRWHPQPYPKGLAAHIALPFLVQRAATGKLFNSKLPSDETLIKTARIISLGYSLLCIGAVWWLARRLCKNPRVAPFAAWCLALAPLFVTQSHFGVADAPALFWMLAAGACLFADLAQQRRGAIAAAGFAVGMALGLKLTVWLIPSLALAVISRPCRLGRSITAAGWTLAGFAACTFLSMSPFDVVKCFVGNSVVPPDTLNTWDFPKLYALELLPSIGALTLVVMAFGLPSIFSKSRHAYAITVALVIPAVLHLLIGLPKLAPFPRHLLPFFPLFALVFGLGATRSRFTMVLAIVALVYLGFAAAGTETRFLLDGRSIAIQYLETDVKKGSTVSWPAYEAEIAALGLSPTTFPNDPTPDVIIAEAYRVNHWLSGTSWRDSRPTDYRRVFDGQSELHLKSWQSLFDGTYEPGYRIASGAIATRFMFEDEWVDKLLGDRSRTYVGDIAIFVRKP